MSVKIPRAILQQEARLWKYIAKELRKNNRAIVKAIKNNTDILQTLQKKDVLSSIDPIIDEYHANIVAEIDKRAKVALQVWYTIAVSESPIIKEIIATWDIDRGYRTYRENMKNLHLSDYKGSIKYTTKQQIRDIITKGVKEGKARDKIAAEIQWLQKEGIFSEARAKLIAQNQMAVAYETGADEPYKILHNRWYTILKKRQTMQDNLVTPTHAINESDGRIPYDQAFSGTGDMMPPGSDNPNCRCHKQHEIVNSEPLYTE